MSKFNVAVVGATGAVGEALNQGLEERNFPIVENGFFPLASAKSVGKTVMFAGQEVLVQDLADFSFKDIDFAFFAARSNVSETDAQRAADDGCVVIDKTSFFRQQEGVPLIIPEVNPHALSVSDKIISNPNCSTIQMLIALNPLHKYSRIVGIDVATYQAVSGTGKNAVDELADQSQQVLDGKPTKPSIYPVQIAFNAIPHIDDFTDNDYTKEEIKMHQETQKILEDSQIWVSATAVRIPDFIGHSEAITIETERPISPEKARELLSLAKGLVVVDDPSNEKYPTAVTHATGSDSVYVGRIRSHIDDPNKLLLWVVGDNLRKGAATNGIQIAELMIGKGFKPKNER